MKINVGKILKPVVRAAKENPETALAIASLLAPGLFRKLAPKVVPIIVAAAGRNDGRHPAGVRRMVT
ncbi:hypothetical protein [Sphingomonas sp. SAFR-052]|uniref:hypothetical protein n=1 Tax=Sphingomonas sp. SAFR-052 TaxID=3436867 RepID=UPI003F7FD682